MAKMIPPKIILETVFNGCAMMFLGLQLSQRGPAFIDMLDIANTDVQGGSFFMAGSSLCYMLGSFLSGFLSTRIDAKALLIGMCIVTSGVLTGATPWCASFVSMLLVCSITFLFSGMFETTLNYEQMRMGEGNSQAAMQFLSFSYSFGGIIGPLITEPFLAPIKDASNATDQLQHHNNSGDGYSSKSENISSEPNISSVEFITIANNHFSDYNYNSNSIMEMGNSSVATDTDDGGMELTIHYAFLITGLVSLVVALPFFVKHCRLRRKRNDKKEDTDATSSSNKIPMKVYVGIVFIAGVYYFLFTAVDDSFCQFLSYFVVNHLKWSKDEGALLTAIYWACNTFVKLIFIFLATRVNLGIVLLVCNVAMLTFCLGFAIVSQFQVHALVWVLTALFSCSMAPIFGGGIGWIDSTLIRANGRVTAVIIISASFGTTVVPIPIGYLMNNWTPMAFIYILFVLSCFDLLIMIVLFVVKPTMNRRYGLPYADVTTETLKAEEATELSNGNTLKVKDDMPVYDDIVQQADTGEATVFI